MARMVCGARRWAAAGALVLLGGCQTVHVPGLGMVVATEGFNYQAGTATQTFEFAAAQVQTAVTEAMADLKIHQLRQTHNAGQLGFEGRTVDGRRALITIDGSAKPPIVTARFGWFGDEALAHAFMDRIGIRLGTLPPSPIAAEPPSSPDTPPFSIGPETTAPNVRRLSDAGYRDTPVP